MNFDFKGVISALPTPFENGKLDVHSLEDLVQYQIKNGISGFVVNGTTAESPTLNWAEVTEIYQSVNRLTKKNIPLIVGVGSNSTEHTIETTKKAVQLGADAVLVVVPYYNKPPQRGLMQHFATIAEVSRVPVIVYNVPSRTVTSLTTESSLALSKTKNIIGMKEASGDLNYDKLIIDKVSSDFVKLSGDDQTYVPFLKLGGDGIISVMSNIITEACVRWTKLAQDNEWVRAEQDFKKYEKFMNNLYIEANPIALKWMLYKMGLFKSAEMRLPLVPLDSSYHEAITTVLAEYSLI